MIRSVVVVLAIVGIVLVVMFLVSGILLWRFQERVVFQPPSPPYPGAQGARRIDFRAEDAQPLFAYLVGDPSATGIVIAFHGNADLAGWQLPWAQELSRRTGRAVLIPEFRGYAGLPGVPTYLGSRLDARAAFAVARDTLGIPAGRIALYGHSLGSAIATELARDVQPEVLLVVAPFTSVREMAHRISANAVLLFRTGLARVHYDTEAIVRTLDVPVWVAHGARDAIIPAEMGRRVFEAAKRRGELLVLENADHNDVTEQGGERYWQWIGRALRAAPFR